MIHLLAQRSRLDNLSGAFRDRPGSADYDQVLTGLLMLAALIVSIWLLSKLVALRERHRVYSSPTRLFLSLCRMHRLSWGDCWLLWRLARSLKLKQPAGVFLDPERFDQGQLAAGMRSRAASLRRLRDRLFAGLEGEQKAPAPRPAAKSAEKRRAAGPLPLAPSAAVPDAGDLLGCRE